MFILGFGFPGAEGNNIPDEKVIAKVEESLKGAPKVSKIILSKGKAFNETIEFSKVDSFLGKCLVSYYTMQDPEIKSGSKYLIYTNKYQMSEISKKIDKDDEVLKLCKIFDGMDPVKVELVA